MSGVFEGLCKLLQLVCICSARLFKKTNTTVVEQLGLPDVSGLIRDTGK